MLDREKEQRLVEEHYAERTKIPASSTKRPSRRSVTPLSAFLER
jgi:hypothetical protein